MFTVVKGIHFCYGHRLLDYDGACRFLHGHNGTVEIEISAAGLDARGMVRDFSEIKNILQSWIDQTLDHRMILNARDPLRRTLETAGEPIFVMEANPTAESIAKLIFETAREKGLPVTSVTLWETASSRATYCA